MARQVYFMVTAQPGNSEASTTQPSEGFSQNVILTNSLYDALKLWMAKIAAGVDTSSVVTAINAL
jgi:hypothetical protein